MVMNDVISTLLLILHRNPVIALLSVRSFNFRIHFVIFLFIWSYYLKPLRIEMK